MNDSVHLLGGNTSPIGVLTQPDSAGSSDIAVIFLNSGLLHRVGPFRVYVSLARRLAESGIASLRIDQSGRGDSERRAGLPAIDAVRKDFEDAAAFLDHSLGIRRFVVLGLCSGADAALYLASEYPQVAGAVLLEAYAFRTPKYYLRHYVPRLGRFDLWMLWAGRIWRAGVKKLTAAGRSRDAGEPIELGAIRELTEPGEVRRRYRAVVERGAKLLCVFTSGARPYYNYEGQLAQSLKVPDGASIAEVHIPDAKHTYPLAAHRERMMSEVCAWLRDEYGT